VPIPVEYQRDDGHSFAWVKWTTSGAAIAAVGVGVYFLKLDGDGTCGRVVGNCPEVYDTDVLGYAAVGAGIALSGLTAYLFVRDPWKTDRRV